MTIATEKYQTTTKKQPVGDAPGLFKLSTEEKKELFLKRYFSGGNKNKYKRYLGSPLRYAGGKSLAVGYIIEHLPVNIQRVISPFFGGGSVEIAIAKERGIPVTGFDIFDILVNYWNIQIKYPEKLYKALVQIENTKESYEKIKSELKAHWKGEKRLDNFTLAVYYYFNHNLSYGPGFLGWMSSIYLDRQRYLSMLERVKNFRLDNLEVYNDRFENVIPKYSKDFLYCDPPYYLEGDSKMFRGIYPQRNFPIHHNTFNHELLRDLLHRHKGKFILSYNDCSTIRAWYKDYKIIEVAWQYMMGQGETRIGENRLREHRSYTKDSHEVLIIKE